MARAGVSSIAGLTDFVAQLAEFGKDAREALSANDMEIQRTLAWLDDQVLYWKKQINQWREAVVQAKSNLNRRKMMKFLDRPPDCTEQEADLKRAQKRLQLSETKLANAQRWGPLLRRAVDEYQGQARHLANVLEADLPTVRAKLTKRIGALEAYVSLAPPAAPAGIGTDSGPPATTPVPSPAAPAVGSGDDPATANLDEEA